MRKGPFPGSPIVAILLAGGAGVRVGEGGGARGGRGRRGEHGREKLSHAGGV